MQSLSDDERKNILGEVLADELHAILEYVKDIPQIKQDLSAVKSDVGVLKSDMKTVKVAIKDMSKQLVDHEQRTTHLETA